MKLLLLENYKSAIKNSVGSKAFRNLYAEVEGNKTDILEDGRLSCAYFVSSLLCPFKLIKSAHATVEGTVRDLKDSGWEEASDMKPGSIVVWKAIDYGNEGTHKHIGFWTENNMAVSNDSEERCPVMHHLNFRDREVEIILWNKILDN